MEISLKTLFQLHTIVKKYQKNFPPTTIQCPEFKSDSCNKNLNYTIFKKKKTMMGKSFHIKVDMGGIYGSKQYKMMNM